MRERLTARVILLDPDDRVLLMKGRLPGAPEDAGAWFTPGGGIEAGETPRRAAAREIVEETGFRDFTVERLLWVGELEIRDEIGPLRAKEHVFLAHCRGGEPSRDGWLPAERALIDDMRWWTLARLRECPDRVFPRDLAERVDAVLAASRATESAGATTLARTMSPTGATPLSPESASHKARRDAPRTPRRG